MAENKKSFIAYSDWNGMFKALPDEVAGKLIKHIFSYVNDEDPSSDDYVINALFEQIKSTLKRDLVKWEDQRQQRVEAGRISAERRATKINDRSNSLNETERNPTVSVSVSGNVNVSDKVNDNKEEKEKAKAHIFFFKKELCALGVDNQLADDFLKVRKTKKATNTKTAFDALIKEFEKTKLTPAECVKIAVEKSWSGFNAEWLKEDKLKIPKGFVPGQKHYDGKPIREDMNF